MSRPPRGGYILNPERGEKPVLYAIAVELWKHGEWVPEIHYVHARSAREARKLFLNSQPGRGRFVATAPAVGFFAADEHGEKLVADSGATATPTATPRSSTQRSAA